MPSKPSRKNRGFEVQPEILGGLLDFARSFQENGAFLRQIAKKQLRVIEIEQDLGIVIVNEMFIRINSQRMVIGQADFAISKIAVNEKYDSSSSRLSPAASRGKLYKGFVRGGSSNISTLSQHCPLIIGGFISDTTPSSSDRSRSPSREKSSSPSAERQIVCDVLTDAT